LKLIFIFYKIIVLIIYQIVEFKFYFILKMLGLSKIFILFFFIAISSTVFAYNNTTRYILHHKNPNAPKRFEHLNVESARLHKRSFIHISEFMFVDDLSQQDLITLSEHYHIEKDQEVSISTEWHLDRVDQRTLPLDLQPFAGNSLDNSNVDIYILDTGIDVSHPEFQGTAIWGANFVGDNLNTDCHSHGTHVASSAGGSTVGVARRSTLVAVKVLGCSGGGSYSGVISGIEWSVRRAQQTGKLSIINMSLGGGASDAVTAAVESAHTAGVYVVVAAGNSNDNACNYSPAKAPSAITVAASDNSDNKASFSNWGTCVDIYAPGACLLGAVPNGGYQVMCGTSMASPIAAGVLATYLSRKGRDGHLLFFEKSTLNVIKNNVPGTPNKFVYYDNTVSTTPTPTPTPTSSSTTSSTTSSSFRSCTPTTTTLTTTFSTTSTEILTTTFSTTSTTLVTMTSTVTRTTRVNHPAPTCLSNGYVVVRGSFSKWGADTACKRLSKSLVSVTLSNRNQIANAVYTCHGDSLGWTDNVIGTMCVAVQGSPTIGTSGRQPCSRRYPAICV
jgi:subtilisin family serine protease